MRYFFRKLVKWCKIIREAVIHGADLGGSYDQNEEGLLEAINEWLKMKELLNQYTISLVETSNGNFGLWDIYQITKM